ncbi:MAG: 16S rRNA (uracil(1498)-N(3))-methyltransferase [Proteobacteria bacterium]|nr:16S rRNA (uracil(1498)-N(3))-methyltransferase [Pseudomonadota bacterium]
MSLNHNTKQPKSGARFYFPRKINEDEILLELPKDIENHAKSSLRLKEGALFYLFDGSGGEYLAKLVIASNDRRMAEILNFSDVNPEPKLKISLVQSVMSNDKMNWLIQKATELGVQEINVFKAERSSLKIYAQQLEKKKLHWHKVAIAACEQSGRTKVPSVRTFLSLADYLETTCSTTIKETKIILSPSGSNTLKNIPRDQEKLTITIGPEGGFAAQELAMAKSNNFLELKLGPRILRAETAGISLVAISQALFGDF